MATHSSTTGMFTSALPVPGLGSRAPDVPTYEASYQAIISSGINEKQNRQLVAFSFSVEALELNFPV